MSFTVDAYEHLRNLTKTIITGKVKLGTTSSPKHQHDLYCSCAGHLYYLLNRLGICSFSYNSSRLSSSATFNDTVHAPATSYIAFAS